MSNHAFWQQRCECAWQCVCMCLHLCVWSASWERWPRGRRGWLKNKLISRADRWETGAQISREIKMLIAARQSPLLSRWPVLIHFYVVIISSQGCGPSLAGREVLSSPQLTNYTERLNWLLMWKQKALWGWGWWSSWLGALPEFFLCFLHHVVTWICGKHHECKEF